MLYLIFVFRDKTLGKIYVVRDAVCQAYRLSRQGASRE
jgi:hypothetical protein